MEKVCHLSSHHSPVSVRIFKKQCRSLAKAGFDVTYVVPGKPEDEGVKDGVEVICVKKGSGLLSRAITKPYRVYKKGKSVNAHIYHFHDPELLPFVYLLHLRGKKIVYDIHEDLPAKIKELKSNHLKFVLGIFAKLAALMETFFVKKFPFNITVNEEIKKRFKGANIEIITNYPLVKLFKSDDVINFKSNEVPIIIYAGLLNRIRGIKEIIDAAGFLNGSIRLVLLGSWQNKVYEDECRESAGWRYTDYLGMLPLEEAYRKIEQSDIGIINFLPLKNHLNSMPNKAFEYMAAGKPMIMSDFKYWKTMFSECAVFADPTNAIDIADKMDLLVTNEKLKIKKAQNARTLIESKFSWESEEKKLIEIYRLLS